MSVSQLEKTPKVTKATAGLIEPTPAELKRESKALAMPALQLYLGHVAFHPRDAMPAGAAKVHTEMQMLEAQNMGVLTIKKDPTTGKPSTFDLFVRDNHVYALKQITQQDYNKPLQYFDCGSLPQYINGSFK